MRFFLDTADPDEARRVREWGLLDGLLLRPDAAASAGRDARRLLAELAQVGDGPVIATLAAGDPKAMYKEARELHKLGKNVVLRVPMTREGLRVVRLLGDEQIATDVGLVYTAPQALLAARAGAAYVSPSVGELDDAGQIGMDVVESIVRVYDNYGLETQISVQGIQNPIHVLDAAALGADVATLPFAVLDRLFEHPLTAKGVALLRSPAGEGPRRIH
ncbi:MAG TPA: transaldolase family protein [Thermoanaerobaculia bacterium]|nr:transaldolase family protein [Thermoanaerobaculia bacterium]